MTLYVQYAKSTNFQNLLYGTNVNIGLNNVLNCTAQDFYNNIFNILSPTITSAGLNIWGAILNTPRNYKIGTREKTFGFNVNPNNITDYAQNFNHGTFYNSNSVFSILPDGEYRCLLILIARMNISNMSIISITRLLNDFFILLQQFGSPQQNYNWVISVSADTTTPNQLNYDFKNTGTGSFPIWLSYIFSTVNIPSNTFYLPLPIGTYPNITYS